MTITPQEIASEFQRLVNRLENAEGALKGLGRFEYETCHAFVSRFLKAHDERFLRLIDERDSALTRAEKSEAAAEDMAVDYGQLQIKVDELTADRDHWQRRAQAADDLVKAYQEKEDFLERVVPAAARQKCADYDEYHTHVDAAFKTLGIRDGETYEACAVRVMNSLAQSQARAVSWNGRFDTAFSDLVFVARQRDEACEDRDAARATAKDLTEALAKLNDEYAALAKERDAYRKAKAENDERFMTERDAARAELTKVREALGTLLNEGKKAP